MQSWRIKELELGASVLNHLDGFIHGHALFCLVGAIYLLLALLVWVLCGVLRPKGGKPLLCPLSGQPLSFICLAHRRQRQKRLPHFRPCETHRIVIATVMISIGIETEMHIARRDSQKRFPQRKRAQSQVEVRSARP
jgi:hypothetical protein